MSSVRPSRLRPQQRSQPERRPRRQSQDAGHLAGQPDAVRELHVLRRARQQAVRAARSRSRPCPPGRWCRRSRCSTRRTRRCSTARTPGPATGSARTRPRSCSPAAPAARSAWTTSTPWAGCTTAAGFELLPGVLPEGAQAQRRRGSRSCPSGPQAFGWFKRPIKNLADFKGMKCRQTGMAAEVLQRMGMQTVNMPGGEIIPSAQRGVIDCAEWVGGVEDLRLGFQNVWKYHYTPGHARERHHRRAADQRRRVEGPLAAAPGDHQVGGERDLPASGGRSGRSRTPTRSRSCRRSTACRSCARRPTS